MTTNNEQSPLDPDIALHESQELEAMTPKKIWGVFWVLTAITSLEFFIALYLVPHHFVGVCRFNNQSIFLCSPDTFEGFLYCCVFYALKV